MSSVDDVLTKLGPWHFWIILFVLIRGFPAAYHAMANTFMAPTLDHWCARPPDLVNWTTEQWRTYGIPQGGEDEGALAPRHCMMYVVEDVDGVLSVSNSTTVNCAAWEYDLGEYVHTLTNQFDLVCNRVWLRAASQSFFMAGIMLGSFVFAHIADWYGRRCALGFMTPLPFIAGCCTAFSTSFLMYNIGRLVASFAIGGIYNTSITYITECLGVKHRSVGTFVVGTGWTSGLLTLVAFAWYLRNWFHLQIAISLFALFVTALWLFIPESPRWLLATGKYEKAISTLEDAVRRNNIQGVSVNCIVSEYKESKAQEKQQPKPSFIDLFTPLALCRTTIVVCLLQAGTTLFYYNLTYSSILLGDNPYLSFAVVAAMEYPSRIASALIITYVRRRVAYMLTFALAGVCSAAAIFVPDDLWWLQLCFATVAKLGISCGHTVVIVQISELYPTTIRTLAMGFSISVSRTGAILAPFTKELGVIFHAWVPIAVDTGVAGFMLLLALTLPETFNTELPDTVQDLHLGKTKQRNSISKETEALKARS